MVFVVAEIGVNWDGDFEIAKSMMENAILDSMTQTHQKKILNLLKLSKRIFSG